MMMRKATLSVLTVATTLLCLVALYNYSHILALSTPFFVLSPIDHNDIHQNTQQQQETLLNPGRGVSILLRPEKHIHRKPTVLHFQWNITAENRFPDGVEKRIYLINGQFPGPTVEARAGDRVVVEVNNHLHTINESVSFHWHGLTMKGNNEMDGVVGLTQCAIPPERSATYNFTIENSQAGTFWYHAHSSMQRADGLYGGLVVHKPVDTAWGTKSDQEVYQYDTEQLALIGDWYHRTAGEVFEFYQNPGHNGLEPAPDSILINGRGQFNCSLAVKARPLNCSQIQKPSLDLRGGGRIRLRVINTGAMGGYSLSLSQSSMKLITVDGGYPVASTTPTTNTIGVLNPGERVDLVVSSHTNHHVRGIRALETMGQLTVRLDTSNMPIENYALNPKQSFDVRWGHSQASALLSTHATEMPSLQLSDVRGPELAQHHGIHSTPAEKSVLYSALIIRPDNFNRPTGSINHTSWVPPASNTALLAIPPTEWKHAIKQPATAQELVVPRFETYGDEHWLELTLNNFDDRGHPLHLHGYEFYVVLQGISNSFKGYNPFDEAAVSAAEPINTKTPLRKDTIYLPPMGYAVLRFPLNNDGLWLLHCHVLWHQAAGMGIFLQVGSQVSPRARAHAAQTCRDLDTPPGF